MKTHTYLRSLAWSVVLAGSLAGRTSAQTYSEQVLADGPASYWRLNELFPPVAPDVAQNRGSLGAAANGSYTGAISRQVPGAVPDDTGVAFSNPTLGAGIYNGSVDIPNIPDLNPADAGFSVEFWAKPSNNTAALLSPVNSMSFTSGRAGYLFYQNGARWQFRIGVATSTTASFIDGGTAVANQWQHVVGVYTGGASGTMRLYVDGVEVASGPATYNPNPNAPFRIGATTVPNREFDGAVDEVAFYNVPLNAEQIFAHYSAGTNAVPEMDYSEVVLQDEPRMYLRLDEAPPSPLTAMATNLGALGNPLDAQYLGRAVSGQPGALVDETDPSVGLNGSNAYLLAPYSPLNNGASPTNSSYTVEFWARVTGGQGTFRFAVGSTDDEGGATRGYFVHASNSNRWEYWTGFGAGAAGSWYVTRGPSIVLNEWAHIVATCDGVNKGLYVNGTRWAYFAPPLISNNLARPIAIGNGSSPGYTGFYFPGNIDEVAVYPGVLPPNRVAAHYLTARGSNPPALTPAVASQPVGFSTYVSGSGRLTFEVLGTAPFNYKWFHNNEEIPGATDSTLLITNATLADGGSYYAEVTTAGGTLTSAGVQVTILPDETPTITQQPRSVNIFEGLTARFNVVATGSLRLRYQWYREGEAIADATNATLVLPNVGPASAGEFNVDVWNADDAQATSESAVLSVLPVAPGSYVSSVLAGGAPLGYWRVGEEPETTIAYDNAGGHNGTYNSVTLGQTGAIFGDPNPAAKFSPASDSSVTVSDPATFNFVGAATFSLEAWVKFDSLPAAGTVARVFSNRRVTGGNGGYGFGVFGDNTLRFTAFGVADADRALPSALETGRWYHLAAVRSGTTVQFYFNGLPLGTPATVGGIASSPQPLQFGRNPEVGNGEEEVDGTLDELAVYNRALSAAEVCAHYYSGTGTPLGVTITRSGTDVIIGWPFGTLEGAASVAGPWATITNGVTTLTLPASQPVQFFRVRKP